MTLNSEPKEPTAQDTVLRGRWLAHSLWVLSAPFAAAAVVITMLSWSIGVPIYESIIPLNNVVIALTFSTVGALVASRRPHNAIGWLLCAIGLVSALGGMSGAFAIRAVFSRSDPMTGAALAAWMDILTATISVLAFPLLLLLFPDGRPPSRRWRPVVWLIVGVIVAESAVAAFGVERFGGSQPLSNPFHIAALDPLWDLYASYAEAPLVILVVLLAAAGLVARFRRSRAEGRQQLKWVVSSGLLAALALIPLFLVEQQSQVLLSVFWGFFVLALCAIPVSMGVAILRYHLWDIDFVINRALVYGALTACVVGLYVLVVGSLGMLLQARGSFFVSLVGTGAVAVLFAPLRERLQRGVNRLMYGERDDPYVALSRLGQRLEGTVTPGTMLPTIVGTVAETLKLPYAAVELERGGAFETVAAAGKPVDKPLHLPLVYGGETVGRLALGPRVGSEDFTSADRRLLDDLARQVGVAVHAARQTEEAVRLSADLQKSRERLVTAREEERRRLRRDLHDELGPQLASLTMRAEAARDLVSTDVARADKVLAGIVEQAQSAVADIRRLVYALRPPALDAFGLLGALRSHASHQDHGGLHVIVEAPEELPSLPAAVEVAAYLIALEATNNTARHANARNCTIHLALTDEMLCLEVTDDGRGIKEERRSGVGLASMRERAEELGGSFAIEVLPAGGTRIRAMLPCARYEVSEPNYREA